MPEEDLIDRPLVSAVDELACEELTCLKLALRSLLVLFLHIIIFFLIMINDFIIILISAGAELLTAFSLLFGNYELFYFLILMALKVSPYFFFLGFRSF